LITASADKRLLPLTEIELSLNASAFTMAGMKRKPWKKKAVRKIETNFAITIAHIYYYTNEYPFPKLMSKVSLSIFKDIKSH
jgi:hypothetical protein